MSEDKSLNKEYKKIPTREQIKQMIKQSYLISLERLKYSTDNNEIKALKKFIYDYENL